MGGLEKKITFIFIIFLLSSMIPNIEGTNDDIIGDPGKIPLISFVKLPEIVQGEKTTLQFTLQNRFENTMENIRITVEIYKHNRDKINSNISDVKNAPFFSGSGTPIQSLAQNPIESMEEIKIVLDIETKKNTTRGYYFFRFNLNFSLKGVFYNMKSIGHFSEEELDFAKEAASSNDFGGLNLTYLGTDGILVESRFSVKSRNDIQEKGFLPGFDLDLIFNSILAIFIYFILRKDVK